MGTAQYSERLQYSGAQEAFVDVQYGRFVLAQVPLTDPGSAR